MAFGVVFGQKNGVQTVNNQVPDINGNIDLTNWNVEKNHPKGSLWITTESDDPALLFGGKWERLPSGATIISADGAEYIAGQVYGANEVKLKESDIPTVRPDTRVGGGSESRNSLFFKQETYQYGTGWQNKKGLTQYNNPQAEQTSINVMQKSYAINIWRRFE